MVNQIVRIFYIAAYRLLRWYWFFARPTTRGVQVAVWHAGRILILKLSYKPLYSVPGGFVKRGENSRAAAIREMQEEVQLRMEPEKLQRIGTVSARYEYRNDQVTIFETMCEELPDVRIDEREIVAAEFMPPEQALRHRLSPVIREYLEEKIKMRRS